MIHLFKNADGTFDCGTVSKGNLVWHTSPQGYERRAKAIAAIRSGIKAFGSVSCNFQDDTVSPSVIYYLPYAGKIIKIMKAKPSKPYIPSTKK
jgi:hypothetical protein